jgi:DNA-binding transcriptional LysR family regulator
MDHNQLATFERIVHEGSFTRAARALGVAQATVSARVQALETELGGLLFVRGGRRATLTARGEAFLPYARRALAVLDEGVEVARRAQTGQHGRVAAGAVDSIADGFLVPVIARFRREHPQVALSIRTGHTPQNVEELADGLVRLGLVTWQYTAGTVDLEVLARFREPLVAVVAPGHPLAVRGAATIEEVVREGNPYHETVWGTPEDARLAPTAARGWGEHELPHGLMHQLIRRGIGAGFLPAPLVEEDVASGHLVMLPLTAAGLTRELALVRHAPAEPLAPAARAFAEAVRIEAARLTREGDQLETLMRAGRR